MRPIALLPLLLVLQILVTIPLARHLNDRPIAIKLGYTPSAGVLKVVSGEHRYALAEWNVLRVLFYFGSLLEKWKNRVMLPPEYQNMFQTLETVVQLDPYNMDAYYFSQAAFTWEIGHAHDVNRLLDYGMRYRTWDFNLPFFAGFNAAFFLKDYESAGRYMERASELSGEPFFKTLAARFYYEADRNEVAIGFLQTMLNQAKSDREKELYSMRLEALSRLREIDLAAKSFREKHGQAPADVHALLQSGFLREIPVDPYGGEFYLDADGRARTTSKLAKTRPGQSEAERPEGQGKP